MGGCAKPKPAANAQEAIARSKMQASVQSQIDYLVYQGRRFVYSQEFDQAMTVSKYILANLDADSQAAKDIFDQAKNEMKNVVNTAASDIKHQLGAEGK